MLLFQRGLILLSLLFACGEASAHSFYVAPHVALTDASGPTAAKEVHLSGGGRAGWLLYEHVRVGVFAHYYQNAQPAQEDSYLPIVAEVSYYPLHSPRDQNALYGSLFFGTTKLQTSIGTGMFGHTDTTFGIAAGYSVKIAENLSLGPEYTHFIAFNSTESYRYWSVQLSLTWWLGSR